MRNTLSLLFCFTSISLFAQQSSKNTDDKKSQKFSFTEDILIEDQNGNLITDPVEREAYLTKKQQYIDYQKKQNSLSAKAQTAVQICSNGGFEEFETISGINVLKDFKYTTADPKGPSQCKAETVIANQYIKQYDPSDLDLMASTVPANFLDEYIGNINAFDQFALKINYRHTRLSALGVVQTKRFKTNNETTVKFNYKTVLQSITNNTHKGEQPYFKARILNKNGDVVSEFCSIGDPTNCIFSQAPFLVGNSVVLYTKNWQSGKLDISEIPNNEEFTIEFMASRCGLGEHFGYAYIDDLCMLHSDENLQGSIELDPLYKICPSMPISVCGNYTVPNSGEISATVMSITMDVYNSSNTIVYSSDTPVSIDSTTHHFCFDLLAANLPNVTTDNYNIGVTIDYGTTHAIDCTGTDFASASDSDANPGWDISFMNCSSTCNFTLQPSSLELCDTDHNGKEFFNLTNINTLIAGIQPGLTFSYFTTLDDASKNTNAIVDFLNYESSSNTIFVRVSTDAACFKIIAVQLVVKNPSATISGILNVCGGNTTLTASPGVSYLWSNGATTQSTEVSTTGIHTVTVTDAAGCDATGTVTIIPTLVAVQPTVEITQPTCSVSTGTMVITSPASEYSYDDGLSWTTNSTKSNLALGNHTVKIKTAAGCTSYNTVIKIVPFLLSFPKFTTINPSSCGGVGSIKITTPATSYSFDDGVTWTSNNTKANLPVGTYLVRTKDELGCISNFNSVEFFSEFLSPPLYTTNLPYCSNLGNITITTPAAEYSFDGGNTWQTSNTLSDIPVGSYVIKIKNAKGCTSQTVYVYLNDLQTTFPKYTQIQGGCGTYASITITTLGDSYSFDGGTTWTANPVLTNLTSNTSYSIIVKKGSCKSPTNYAFVTNAYLDLPPANDYQATECDNLNDGSENINLTNYNSKLIANSQSYNFTYFKNHWDAENNNLSNQITNITSYNLSNSNNQIYVRVSIPGADCVKVAELKFTLFDAPAINTLDAYTLCENKPVTINAGSGFDSYLWSTQEKTQTITVPKPGYFWVNVTENHGLLTCNSTKKFNVFSSNPATITSITTKDWSDTENMISVYHSGLGNYEFSLDDKKYQDSNIFTNLLNGEYTVYVKDKLGCGTTTKDVYLLMYPKFFTPNGDGSNDLWRIRFSETEKNLTVKIFDRLGKLLKIIDSNGWDGTYNGQLLPSTDYWFIVTRENGKEYKGHFSMKR